MSGRRAVGRPPRQSPYRRRYPDGRTVWVARWRDLAGKQRYAAPRWNGGKATFERKGDAQRAIDEALEELYGLSSGESRRIGSYSESWTRLHPRAARTNKTYNDRVSCALGIEIEGRQLRDWEFDELRRRQVLALVDHMLCEEGRAVEGVRGIVRALSAMTEDAIGDDSASDNPFVNVRLRADDPRVRKPPRRIRVWSFDQMRAFAAAGRADVRSATRRPPDSRNSSNGFFSPRNYEPLLLTPALTGLRLGEFLALRRSDFDGGVIQCRFSAHNGRLVESSKQKNHRREIPVPPTLATILEAHLATHESEWIFPTPRGKLFSERNFYRDVWTQAKIASGLDPTPHEFRHSYVTQLRASKIDDADLAAVVGHRVETMLSVYTHPLGRSHSAIRDAIG